MIFFTVLFIIIFSIAWWYLVEYIKYFNTGDPNETAENYWKFSYDFKSTKKEDYQPDPPDFLRRKRFRNSLVFLLYIDILVLFLLFNSLASQILEKIYN
tara:strand:- start:681 stop:977 length:297 start_codon:yes stop_codon:yes gene_type:complete